MWCSAPCGAPLRVVLRSVWCSAPCGAPLRVVRRSVWCAAPCGAPLHVCALCGHVCVHCVDMCVCTLTSVSVPVCVLSARVLPLCRVRQISPEFLTSMCAKLFGGGAAQSLDISRPGTVSPGMVHDTLVSPRPLPLPPKRLQ